LVAEAAADKGLVADVMAAVMLDRVEARTVVKAVTVELW